VQLPQPLIDSLRGLPGFEEDAFIKIHQSEEKITSLRINPAKVSVPQELSIFTEDGWAPVPWCDNGFYLEERPSFTFDPLFHAGCYYVQEASSMFLEQALRQTTTLDNPLRVLDLCASPGGKSTHIQSLISEDSLLVSNEVIRPRVQVLRDNITRWGSSNAVVTSNDPEHFAGLTGYFDVMVVDAPCSGSGLFRRDPEAISTWSTNVVSLCSQRQQRILANALPSLKKGGILIYSTCSYSASENEGILDWFSDTFSVKSLPLAFENAWGVTHVQTDDKNHGYRFWPYLSRGEGFFIAAFRKEDGEDEHWLSKPVLNRISRKEEEFISPWVNTEGSTLVNINDKIYAWPNVLADDISYLAKRLRAVYSGTCLGSLAHEKLIPDHALAMSPVISERVLKAELSYDLSIAYLQRKNLPPDELTRGWQLVTFRGHPLGWINALSNRVNNYFPKELRILKEKDI
jgi:16S rRNA C967 or C1407 C5-methylase (RsmB/RsmF family)/NOL1/NOP2/fmu family ribosome biogenesis protein